MNWIELPISSVDTETTGKEPTDRVVEVAAVVIHNGKPSAKWERRVNPGIPIPPDASEVHGIKDTDVEDLPTMGAIWSELWSLTSDTLITAYNAPFDHGMLEQERARHDRVALAPVRSLWLDPLVWAREFDKYEKGKRLVDVAKRRNIPTDGAHGAMADALMNARVMWVMRNQVPSKLDELLGWQEDCRKKQEAEYAKWRADQQKKAQAG